MFEMTSPGIYNLIQSFIEFTPHFGEGIHCNRLNHSNDSIFQLINISIENVRTYLNHTLPLRWIGRSGQDDLVLNSWPPRSPDLTPCDFSYGVSLKTLSIYHLFQIMLMS